MNKLLARLPDVSRHPLSIVFVASLLLSLISLAGMVGPNRDGMLYIETANIFNEEGWTAAKANFDWVFFPIAIALFSRLTGLEAELAGYVLNALLLAGAAASLVAITRRQFPEATTAAIFVALALPGLNEYRFDLIRENGYWLLCLLAVVAALRWQKNRTWSSALLPQFCLGGAALFRVEAVAFLPALFLWGLMLNAPSWKDRLRNAAQLNSLALLGAIASGPFLLVQGFEFTHRLSEYLTAANPFVAKTKFATATQALAAALPSYSVDEVTSILFFGLFSIIPVKWLDMLGIFVIPLAYALRPAQFRDRLATWNLMGYLLLIYTLVLTAFVTYQLFLTGRYVSFLATLTLPLVAVGVHELVTRWPRLKWPVIMLCIVLALSHVISLSKDKKTQFREAGQWLASQAQMHERIYLDSPRTGYYAGKAYRKLRHQSLTPEQIEEAARTGRFEYYVFEIRRKDKDRETWVSSMDLQEIQRFRNQSGDAVVVFQRSPLH
ncbi:MAG: hypothetical protein CVU34_08980 [Betaproteobacteria bacterium HGW-Betaproteobacteria-7]|jgi:hypothetical protein|nr:MAG: hypothetical protein CVU34_08980 [Betaproteobacteria bacterium HGW-Betaproteobacteria-7]